MRDGNHLVKKLLRNGVHVVSLPMRDGNPGQCHPTLAAPGVVSLPMRDGNTSRFIRYFNP